MTDAICPDARAASIMTVAAFTWFECAAAMSKVYPSGQLFPSPRDRSFNSEGLDARAFAIDWYFLGFNSFVLAHNVKKFCVAMFNGDPTTIAVSFVAVRTKLSVASLFLSDPRGVFEKLLLVVEN
jgi:hypothetical protein